MFVIADNPPPDAYNPVMDPNYYLNARPQDHFGSDSKRDNLLQRDIAKSPFRDSTCI